MVFVIVLILSFFQNLQVYEITLYLFKIVFFYVTERRESLLFFNDTLLLIKRSSFALGDYWWQTFMPPRQRSESPHFLEMGSMNLAYCIVLLLLPQLIAMAIACSLTDDRSGCLSPQSILIKSQELKQLNRPPSPWRNTMIKKQVSGFWRFTTLGYTFCVR